MEVLHGTWIPEKSDRFLQSGQFYLWVETDFQSGNRSDNSHPSHLRDADLAQFLQDTLGLKPRPQKPNPRRQKIQPSIASEILPRYFLLPTDRNKPLPSWEMAQYMEMEVPENVDWDYWEIDCYPVLIGIDDYGQYQASNAIKLLQDLHFLTQHRLIDVQMGTDLLFWYHYTQQFKQVILRDQYIPALKYRPTITESLGRNKIETETFEIYPGWEIISESYSDLVKKFSEEMPPFCSAGFAQEPEELYLYQTDVLLQHFSEVILTEIVLNTPKPSTFTKKYHNTLLQDCLYKEDMEAFWDDRVGLKYYHQWREWRDRITHAETPGEFVLAFCVREPARPEDDWKIVLQVAPIADPSQLLDLKAYWQQTPADRKALNLGADFEQSLLLHLGYAARIYPKLWEGLDNAAPALIQMPLGEAFDFLQEEAWVLEEAGYRVIVPAWWTPKGRQRAKVRLKADSKKGKSKADQAGYFSATTLASYDYEFAIGDQAVSKQEWSQLVQNKAPLVQFRGQWMAIDRDKMQQMMDFWQKQRQTQPEMSLVDLLRISATDDDSVELQVDHDRTLSDMMRRLGDKSALEEVADPAQFQGQLRPYQRRGVGWLAYLEMLGLNGCLADDMGMGKSAQVIARLIHERDQAEATPKKRGAKPLKVRPTLLIAPTSVIGNWGKELEKFAPHLRFILHHGSDRIRETKAFTKVVQECDVVITSYALVRLDEAMLSEQAWQRVVIDEAQNIKNPKAAQTKAILKLPSQHRLALTGTPVENRLLDLWSIFNFLNPGYLGRETQFRSSFELPIQRDNDLPRSLMLKKLVEPFILRRIKTDPAIIQDLPDKVEQKCYCNLTKEQAALYEVVVKDVNQKIETLEGIQRKGMILATLTKLKQICNHPAQFLQDNSDFTPARSQKLERLMGMIEEVMAEGQSLLIFTQFTDIGESLEKLFRQQHYQTYYLHGGTQRKKREKMIAEFQEPETGPAIFILSLKAGGVGITLTKANHVFHFDRWWNPAVEDQATDRAFRIGQTQNVFVHKFIALGTLEEKIDQMIEDKKKLAGAIVGSDESWLNTLDNQAFKQLIALNRKAIVD
jgi:SNF2 family DNA or RNA helicase